MQCVFSLEKKQSELFRLRSCASEEQSNEFARRETIYSLMRALLVSLSIRLGSLLQNDDESTFSRSIFRVQSVRPHPLPIKKSILKPLQRRLPASPNLSHPSLSGGLSKIPGKSQLYDYLDQKKAFLETIARFF